MKLNSKIIVALDGLPVDKIVETGKMFEGQDIVLKVNDALDEPGPQILTDLLPHGETMADAKYYDIPKTMGNRVSKITKRDPKFITIHAGNSLDAIRAAVAARGEANILAVTVLTSIKEEECKRIFGEEYINKKVLQLAIDAIRAGVQGIVCSAAELISLSSYPEVTDSIIVTPAIRPLWYQKLVQDPDDQDPKRTMTPTKAFELGADYVVMGRPLLEAPGMTPAEALKATLEEIEAA